MKNVRACVMINEYKFVDLHIGQEEHFEYIVTQERVDTFKSLTGDLNPLHINREYAIEKGFGGCVVYGMLTASLISTLAGCYLPGKYCLIQQIESKFVAPVYVGDVLTVTGVVKKKYESVRRADIKVNITNQNNRKVVKAILSVGFLE